MYENLPDSIGEKFFFPTTKKKSVYNKTYPPKKLYILSVLINHSFFCTTTTTTNELHCQHRNSASHDMLHSTHEYRTYPDADLAPRS